MPGKERETKPFGKDLPSKLDLVNFINNGQIPFLHGFRFMDHDSYYLIVPFTGIDNNIPTLLQPRGDPICFSYYSGNGIELVGEKDNGLRKKITENSAKKINKFLNGPDIINLKALNFKKKAVELEVKEKISKIQKIKAKKQKITRSGDKNYILPDVEILRQAITQHAKNLNSVRRDISEQIENQTKLITPNL